MRGGRADVGKPKRWAREIDSTPVREAEALIVEMSTSLKAPPRRAPQTEASTAGSRH
uniref:Uncharacterized protein n=1 Tax=Dulem virus 38 TaxID=3145756 RepID=A0AAU8B304_9CAUD